MSAGGDLDLQREESERLLRQANLLQMRGQHEEAVPLCRQAVEADPRFAAAWELLGDLLLRTGELEEAREAYKRAHELEPKRITAERKYAELVLQIAEEAHQRQLWEQMVEQPEQPFFLPKRNPGWALLLSMCLPGVGQLYNGDFLKGGLIIGLTVFGWLLLFAVPGGKEMMENLFLLLFAPTRVRVAYLSPLLLGLFIALFCIYLYALIDAPLRAAQYNKRLK